MFSWENTQGGSSMFSYPFLPRLSCRSSSLFQIPLILIVPTLAEPSLTPTVEYVTCKICKSPDTLLSKENRLDFVTCESCGSSEFGFYYLPSDLPACRLPWSRWMWTRRL